MNLAGGGQLTSPASEPITPVRREIARRLTEVAAIPQVTTFRTVDCTELDAFRRSLGLSPLPVFVAALALTCADHPFINASWQDDGIHTARSVHVGIAIDTERGLMVPVMQNTHAMGIAAIDAEIGRLAEAARGGHLRPNDLHGATIGVSNTGSYGSEAGTPLLNPGNAVTTFSPPRRDASSTPVATTPAIETLSTAKAPATPAVRKLAKERGIDLATITGTGPGGRITVQDLNASRWVASSTSRALSPSPPFGGRSRSGSPRSRRSRR